MRIDDLHPYLEQAARELEQTAVALRHAAAVQSVLGDRPINTLQINRELDSPLTCLACGIPIALGETYLIVSAGSEAQIYHPGLQQCVSLLVSRLTFVLETSYPSDDSLPDVHHLDGS